jgi:hypothetical protein
LVEGVDDGHVIVEVVEGLRVGLGFGGLVALEGFALVFGEGFFALAGDVAEDVVAFFELVPDEGGVGYEAEEEVIEIDCEELGAETAQGVETGSERELDYVGADLRFGFGRAARLGGF